MNYMIFKGVSETPPLHTQHNYTEEDFIYDVSLSLAIISAKIIVQSFGKCERIYTSFIYHASLNRYSSLIRASKMIGQAVRKKK